MGGVFFYHATASISNTPIDAPSSEALSNGAALSGGADDGLDSTEEVETAVPVGVVSPSVVVVVAVPAAVVPGAVAEVEAAGVSEAEPALVAVVRVVPAAAVVVVVGLGTAEGSPVAASRALETAALGTGASRVPHVLTRGSSTASTEREASHPARTQVATSGRKRPLALSHMHCRSSTSHPAFSTHVVTHGGMLEKGNAGNSARAPRAASDSRRAPASIMGLRTAGAMGGGGLYR